MAPIRYLREALGGEVDEHLVEDLFKETREFSERVHAIGLWQKKVLPWVQVPREPWLPPEAVGLVVDGAPVQLPAERIAELAEQVRDAIDEGRPEVVFDGIPIPATEQTLVLDTDGLASADWVLTTYETLRDYQHSFGRIRFGVVVFDEIQKIKTPGTQVTDAAKAMQAEFALALTGTPIENRLADLWCLMDTLHPGALGGLKEFSRRYEDRPDPEDLRRLKDALSVPGPERPAVMLRRMKDEVLEGLPSKTEHVRKVPMPDVQANAYSAVVAEARRRKDRGKMLEALQAMRAVSLAPLERSVVASDQDYVCSSGRLMATISILDEIRNRGEKALLFVEMRAAQADLAGVLQRRYGLARAPMIISGEVAGPRRQERVDTFQAGPPGFDVMILSPKAGGVGLTLTAANNVVHLTRWWNPAVEDQSTDRCYRIGQERPVNVYLPMALLPGGEEHSFDSRLHALLAQKRALSRDLLMPPALSDEDARRLYEETIA